jgi:predicted RNA methylase
MPTVGLVRDALKRRLAVPDVVFDAVYPCWAQEVSHRFWTPVHVAVDAATALRRAGATHVLDVGSGVGKFAVVAALAAGLNVTGVEHRPQLVASARSAAARYQASVRFVCARIEEVDARAFDAFYLFNPFGENLVGADEQLDDAVTLSSKRFAEDVTLVERWLEDAPAGTSLVTYNGFGGRIPGSYRMTSSQPSGRHFVRLWRKRDVRRGKKYSFVELADNVITIAGPTRRRV